MKERTPKSIIPNHIVDNLVNTLRTQHIKDFMRRTNFEMLQKQPQLHKELIKIAMENDNDNGKRYMLGSFLSFNVIDAWLQQKHKTIIITQEDLEVHWKNVGDFRDDQSWHDSTWAGEQLATGNIPRTGLSLSEKLNFYSQFFKAVLGNISTSLQNYESKSAFLNGARDVALPFFAKIEAEELDKKFFG